MGSGSNKVLWILGNSSCKYYATTPLHVRIPAVATILLASSDSTLGALRTATPIQPDLAPPRLRRRRHSWVSCQAKNHPSETSACESYKDHMLVCSSNPFCKSSLGDPILFFVLHCRRCQLSTTHFEGRGQSINRDKRC